MAEPQLSVRSARARDLAHRLARREQRSVADIVERALIAYEAAHTGRERADQFYDRLSRECSADIDLDEVLREQRTAHRPVIFVDTNVISETLRAQPDSAVLQRQLRVSLRARWLPETIAISYTLEST